MRIGLLIRALTVGGAERQLVNLARGLRRDGLTVYVIVMYRAETFLEAELVEAGVSLVDLGKRGRWDIFGFLRRLRRTAGDLELDVVYSFLPTANVLAAILWGRGNGPALVWGVRSSDGGRDSHDWLGKSLVRAQGWLAERADAVIANSSPAITACRSRGWPPDRLHLVPNGLDGEAFRFQPEARDRLRSAWEVAEGQRVIGVAGRLDPVKGLEDFLPALAQVSGTLPSVRAVIAGNGAPGYVAPLRDVSTRLGLEPVVRWLGPVREMSAFYSAVDLLCLPSRSEGCSNVVAEALSCGTPVVATRVGDNAAYVQDASRLAEPGQPGDLANAILRALKPGQLVPRDALRRGILEQLALPLMVQRTVAVLRSAVARRHSSRAS